MATTLNSAQLEILDMMSYIKSEETLNDLKEVISDFFARQAQEEINRLWETGELNEEKVESFRYLHERTPYK
jgi:capsule polysaccharide export protein KpsE/RkpR